MTTSFLGIPIDGDIIRGERRTEQRPLAELTPLIQAVLSDPLVEYFGWRQYTPYFNDGEPCTFSAHGLWAKPRTRPAPERIEGVGVVEVTGPFPEPQDDEDEDDARDGSYEVSYGSIWRPYRNADGPVGAAHGRLMALSDAIDGGAFDDVLLEAFGDHADIRVTRSKIHVDVYSHD